MSQDPKPDYEAPKVEKVDAEDTPAVTAAGETSDDVVESDLRLKRSLRPLGARIMRSQPDYEAPKVEQVETEDAPAVTAAGGDSGISDLRLKRSLRPLAARIIGSQRDYETPKVEQVETEDAPAVTAAGDTSDGSGGSDLRLKRSLRPLGTRIIGPR